MFKRFTRVIPMMMLALALCFSGFFPANTVQATGTAEPTIEVRSASAKPGDEVTLEIYVDNNPGIMGMQLELYYDQEALQIIGGKDGGLFDEATISKSPSTYPFVLLFVASDAGKNMPGNGLLAEVTFLVKEETVDGYYDVSIRYEEDCIFDADYENVRFKTLDGGIKVDASMADADKEKKDPEKISLIDHKNDGNPDGSSSQDATDISTTGTSNMGQKVWIPIVVVVVIIAVLLILARKRNQGKK